MTNISREAPQDKHCRFQRQSHQQPFWHVLVLGSLTCSVYLVYWAYKTWLTLKHEASQPNRLASSPALSIFQDINPLMRTMALFAPPAIFLIPLIHNAVKMIVGEAILIYVLATLIVGVAALVPYARSFPRRHPLWACGLLLGSGLALSSLAKLEGLWYLPSLTAGALPCAVVQQWLNQYWRVVEPGNSEVRQAFNLYEIIAIIAGASLVGLAAAGLMIGVPGTCNLP